MVHRYKSIKCRTCTLKLEIYFYIFYYFFKIVLIVIPMLSIVIPMLSVGIILNFLCFGLFFVLDFRRIFLLATTNGRITQRHKDCPSRHWHTRIYTNTMKSSINAKPIFVEGNIVKWVKATKPTSWSCYIHVVLIKENQNHWDQVAIISNPNIN